MWAGGTGRAAECRKGVESAQGSGESCALDPTKFLITVDGNGVFWCILRTVLTFKDLFFQNTNHQKTTGSVLMRNKCLAFTFC